MKLFFRIGVVTVTACLLFLAFSVGNAQRRGGAPRGGGGFGGAPFGGGSVVHRNFSPPAGVARPNLPAPSSRPNAGPTVRPRPDLPNIPARTHPGGSDSRPHTPDRPNLPDRPMPAPGGHGPKTPDRPNHVDPPRIGGPGHDGPHGPGPDWKRWQNIDPGKIHDSIVHRVDIDKHTIVNVRNHYKTNYGGRPIWTDDWFAHHPGCWRPVGPPPPPPFWWHHPDWNRTWGWFGAGFLAGVVADAVVRPVPYDYGSNIVYEGETVYINGVPYVGADEYYRQAQELAEAEAASTEAANAVETAVETPKDDWLPMGTFAIVADNKQTESKRIVQLATNKQGQVRGNIVDVETNQATELYGNVDSKTQRVAFKVRGHDDVVAECGLWNLTQETVPLLVHLDENRTEERTLVRLHDDAPAETEPAP